MPKPQELKHADMWVWSMYLLNHEQLQTQRIDSTNFIVMDIISIICMKKDSTCLNENEINLLFTFH